MLAIYQKELKLYFSNLFGYLYIAIVLLFMGIFTSYISFKNMIGDIVYSLDSLAIIVLLVTPLLTMRIIAEERQRKTDQLLYSLPVSVSATVMAKYLAMLTVFIIPMAVICIYPIVFSALGTVNMVKAYGAICAFSLMGASVLAIGMFISALTENQVISAIISFMTMLVIYFASPLASLVPTTAVASFGALTVVILLFALIVYIMIKNYLVALSVATVCEVILAFVYRAKQTVFQGLFSKIIEWLSLYDRCVSFYEGIFDLTAVVYYLSVIFLFVFLSIQAVEKRRWS